MITNPQNSITSSYSGHARGAPLSIALNTMVKLSNIILISSTLLLAGCGNESRDAISKYSGDGDILYLPKPGLFGIDGVEIRFPDMDLSKDQNLFYSLDNLPEGDPYTIFFVVPDTAPLTDIQKNKIHIRALKNGKTAVDFNLHIGDMINNVGMGLNRFYCNKNFDIQPIPCQLDAESSEGASIEVTYINTNINKPQNGYLLLSRGGYK